MDDLWFEKALLADGWASDVRISLAGGRISAIAADVRPVARDQRHAVALPGLPNLHSHAFQGAMAGRAEQAGGGHRVSSLRDVDGVEPFGLYPQVNR